MFFYCDWTHSERYNDLSRDVWRDSLFKVNYSYIHTYWIWCKRSRFSWILCKRSKLLVTWLFGIKSNAINLLWCLMIAKTTLPTHCDITMGVYCDIITSLSCNTFHEWGSHGEHFTCSGEATTMNFFIVFQMKINNLNGNVFNKYTRIKTEHSQWVGHDLGDPFIGCQPHLVCA